MLNIEVNQHRLEALIHKRMASGYFQTIEDALVQALEAAPLPSVAAFATQQRTGPELVEAMRAMPFKDEIEFGEHLPVLSVRDVDF